jgi:hypothetical protein
MSNDIKIDQIIRSKRRTISLEVIRDGSLIVRAPIITTRGQIDELVKSKEPWIRVKQELLKKQSLEVPAKQFIPGEQFLYYMLLWSSKHWWSRGLRKTALHIPGSGSRAPEPVGVPVVQMDHSTLPGG